ncbi:longitudinals lacking protein-like isoform X3 [Thrips palmi]|uniref:Longitudinals lacking protein-like isoform X3 n=1 Tax=Thrips palmi TaxID=161013 RepID=A0A6P8ZX29_THRPL|nr:longitudinals lacking protein-like isoform X3 [Thrips palmi]
MGCLDVIMADQQFCLRWNNHQNTLISVFDTLLEGEILVDCTLAAEGKFLRAHKVVLSACSPFFSDLLRQHYEQHPILIMKDVKFEQLKAMLDYMYRGEVKISQDQLGTFLKAAESLQIKGLSDSTSNCESQPKQKTTGESNTLRTLSKADGDLTSSVSRSPTNRRKKRRHPSGSCDDVVSEENSNDRLCESNTPPPTKLSVESRMSKVPSPTVPQDNDSGAVNEATRNVPFQSLPVSTSVMYSKGGLPQQQPSSLIDTLVFEPKSEFIELDEDEDMNQDDSVAEAGPSHSQDDSGGYNWHVDRPEDSYLSQESPSGPRNAQGMQGMRDWLSNRNSMEIPAALQRWAWSSLQTQQPMSQMGFQRTGWSGRRGESRNPRKDHFRCPQCGKVYTWKCSLSLHLRQECGKEPQFQCPHCPHRTKQKGNLEKHIFSKHSDIAMMPATSFALPEMSEMQLPTHIFSKHSDVAMMPVTSSALPEMSDMQMPHHPPSGC